MKIERDFYQVSLKIILKNDKEEILLLKGNPRGIFAGFYDLPGGRINTDEFSTPFSEIMMRELKEEVGDIECTLNPVPVALGRHFVPASRTRSHTDTRVLYVLFEAYYHQGDIHISPEHSGFRWVDLRKESPEKLLISGNLEGIQMYLSKY